MQTVKYDLKSVRYEKKLVKYDVYAVRYDLHAVHQDWHGVKNPGLGMFANYFFAEILCSSFSYFSVGMPTCFFRAMDFCHSSIFFAWFP